MTSLDAPPLIDRLTLVADIGGTNTRVALAHGADVVAASVRRFHNDEFAGLEAVLRAYLADQGEVDCDSACVAIAGPVRDGRGTLTNLDWTIDEATLARATRAETVAVLNDLQAQGHALGFISDANLREVLPGPCGPEAGSQLVIGIGTGFNAAPVHHLGAARLVVPAESGHGDLPIRTERELALTRHLQAAHGFAEVEDVLSGRGLQNVHAWLCAEAGDAGPPARSTTILAGLGDDPRATEAVSFFVTMLGRVAGNLALDHLPFGGVFLAGGMARAVAPHLAACGFAEAFRDMGRFGDFMLQFGVFVIEDDFAALTGSAAHMARLSA